MNANSEDFTTKLTFTREILGPHVVCPLRLINWKDIDVWLYILSEDIDFNDAYRLGFPRVGCFCYPNGSLRNEILGKIYSPEQSNQWNDYLLSFAKKTGIDNPEKYLYYFRYNSLY